MKNYFDGCKTLDDLKKRYRQLAKQYHPDLGGDGEIMKVINSQYERLFDAFQKSGSHTAGTAAEQGKEATKETAREFIDIISKLLTIPEIDIEICGSWIWISGNTYPQKSKLKDAGCKWSSKKTMWYWHSGAYRKVSKRSVSMQEIREIYGSKTVKVAAAIVTV